MSAPGKLNSEGLGNTAALPWILLEEDAIYPDWMAEAIGERYNYRIGVQGDGWCQLLITEAGKYVISLGCDSVDKARDTAQAYEVRDKQPGFTLAGTGEIPGPDLRPVRPGQLVKLLFIPDDGVAESMWVEVSAATPFGGFYRGSLMNTPMGFAGLQHGDEVKFRIENVIDIYRA